MGANAVTTVPVYVAGEVLTAADLNITNSGIPVFATTVTRDAAFGGTGEKTLAEGQFAYIEATNTTQYYDGAAWQSVGVAPGLVYITGASFTSATTISMAAGVFTSTYKTYQVVFQVTSGGDAQVAVRVNNAGSPRTAGNYLGGANRAASDGSNSNTGSAAGSTSVNVSGTNTTNRVNLTLSVYSPDDSGVATTFGVYGFGANNSNLASAISAGGIYTTAEANDGLTFTSGAAVTGFYRVYGLSES